MKFTIVKSLIVAVTLTVVSSNDWKVIFSFEQ